MFTEQGGRHKRRHIMFDLVLRRPSPWSTTSNKYLLKKKNSSKAIQHFWREEMTKLWLKVVTKVWQGKYRANKSPLFE